MIFSTLELDLPEIADVHVSEDTLAIDLADGRSLSVPLAGYPRLLSGAPAERSHGELIGRGHGIHWSQLDEDISIANLLAGQQSAESPNAFKRWFTTREKAA
ncbi:MAG: DUF2442 domain-containing protein [Betaproteobacteria bacterium HGW-Betaproteobacteria-10]|jgi:hypothetical protein|nr:MAG: DUF2442 domain-containing protein [Betaproteobacteria bacterium HGW-Betaproteobacteria-10]